MRPPPFATFTGQLPDGVWQAVSSSNVAAARRVGLDLEVRFLAKGKQPARTWRYAQAGRLLEQLVAASSAGRFVWHFLRPQYGDGVEVT